MSAFDPSRDDMGYQPKLQSYFTDWVKHFAWLPVRIHDRLVWGKTVYRRRSKIRMTASGLIVSWEYGTLFDVLKTAPHVVTTVEPPIITFNKAINSNARNKQP